MPEKEKFFFIWSKEHQAWWRPCSTGYTKDIDLAGQYSEEATTKILAQANIVSTNEWAVPIEAVRSIIKEKIE